MSKIKRFEVVRPEYSFEYIHPILGRLGGEVISVCKPLYKIVIPKRVRK
nr:MAG TPA: hypothetical protein [Caudoviricetes sp.]